MNLEIHTTVRIALFLSAGLAVLFILVGIRKISKAGRLPYFRKRRDLIVQGWRLLFGSILLIGLAFFLNSYAEPVIYTFYEPSATNVPTATITLTPSTTLTPTITLTPSITLTPLESNTPTTTSTPAVPMAIETSFSGLVTPDPNSVFSPLQFAKNLDPDFQPIDPDTTFKNPIKHMYGIFSFDQMMDGSQWTSLWYRDGELVYFETKPWDGGTGGYGFTDWAPDPSAWLPGNYEVQIFNGVDWKVSGQFTVTGDAPAPVPTATSTFTPSITPSITPSRTQVPTKTLRPTNTTVPTRTSTNTRTPTRTKTPTVDAATAAG